jgi:hypothetical protein
MLITSREPLINRAESLEVIKICLRENEEAACSLLASKAMLSRPDSGAESSAFPEECTM